MCMACLLINKSLPSAKTLVNAKKEFDIPEDHFQEVVDLAVSKLQDDEVLEYFEEVSNEVYLDFLRNS